MVRVLGRREEQFAVSYFLVVVVVVVVVVADAAALVVVVAVVAGFGQWSGEANIESFARSGGAEVCMFRRFVEAFYGRVYCLPIYLIDC